MVAALSCILERHLSLIKFALEKCQFLLIFDKLLFFLGRQVGQGKGDQGQLREEDQLAGVGSEEDASGKEGTSAIDETEGETFSASICVCVCVCVCV